MKTYIYRCSRKPDLYIYLAEKDDFSTVPKDIYHSLGIIEFAMELELSTDRKLARENPVQVLKNLEENKFHIQLASETSIEELLAKSGKL